MNGTCPALKIAILINGYESSYRPLTLASFKSAITAASPLAAPPTVDFYDPIVAQAYPDPSQYDLIVLSGGTADPMGTDPWVLKVQDFLRTNVAEYPKQKFLGICWGHQTICVTFGGSVGNMEGPELGVTEVKLTADGRRMFPFAKDGNMLIHEFHRRELKAAADGFVPLAEDNQSFLNEANTILTFQGHPELNSEVATTMLAAAPSYLGVQGAQKDALMAKVNDEHNGVDIWRRILAWVKE